MILPKRPSELAADSSEKESAASLLQYSSSFGYSAAGTATSSRSTRAARSSRRGWFIAAGAVLPVVLVIFWQFLSTSGLVPSYRLPTPVAVVQSGIDLAVSGLLGQYIAISLQRVLLGFFAGAIVGLALGALVGLSRWGSAFLSPTIGGIRAVPSLAWVPLLIMYLGINEDSKVTLIAIGALFPVYTTVSGALRHVDPHLVELGRAYGLGRMSLLAQVQLPAVIPSVVSGLRLALAQSWLFLVAAELIASSMGLGFLLVDSQNNGRIDRIFLAIIILAVLGKTTDALIGLLERYLLKRWG
ncbi:sulfonate transport system permease protein [Microbacteriaceae bacterium SG_E_30_P1]|uniref:Sulfonate transport system permease protein n=1 Tax=Antiquaquibacter oligotrophicus TaxID=2880260 RepID=A0ABT6KLS9_9MICO|nr:sulfonate transport system permease protein [Antiquaquibacter oligotrophicus]